MRYLISSFLILFCVCCTSYPKKNNFISVAIKKPEKLNPYFSNPTKDYIYKANITAFNNNLGGIFIVKKLENNHHRIVFTTELGNKIFDFTFKDDDFKVNYILEKLDKKTFLRVLKEDFRVLITENPTIKSVFLSDTNAVYQADVLNKKHFYFQQQEQLNKITKVKNGNSNVEFLFSEINSDLAGHIEIKHNNFKLTIHLTSI